MERTEDRAATFAGAMRIRAIRASVRVLGMVPGMAVVWCALELKWRKGGDEQMGGEM